MDDNDRIEQRDFAEEDARADRGDAGRDDGSEVDPAAATLIGTNLAGMNAAPYPGGIVAPAAELAAEEATDEGTAAADLGGLEQFASKPRATGDQGVSAEQAEVESDELNG